MYLCPVGLASSQNIDTLTACLTKEQNLKMECKFTPAKSNHKPVCTYRINDKVAASTDESQAKDDMYKNRATVDIKDKTCELHLTGFKSEASELYNCTITQDQPVSKALHVEKSKICIYIYQVNAVVDKKKKCSGLPNSCFSFLVTSSCFLLLCITRLFLFLAHALGSVGLSQHNWILH